MAPFSPQDAQLLINTVESAPLQNLKHADAVSGALQRAHAHFQNHFNPPLLQSAPVPAGTSHGAEREQFDAVEAREMEAIPYSSVP